MEYADNDSKDAAHHHAQTELTELCCGAAHDSCIKCYVMRNCIWKEPSVGRARRAVKTSRMEGRQSPACKPLGAPRQSLIVVPGERPSLCKRLAVGAILGGFGGLCLALCVIVIAKLQPDHLTCSHPNCLRGSAEQGDFSFLGFETYFKLFGKEHSPRRILTSSNTMHQKGPLLVVAGKLHIDGVSCNIGEMDLREQQWSKQERIQLSLYASYSGAEVYKLLANHTVAIGAR